MRQTIGTWEDGRCWRGCKRDARCWSFLRAAPWDAISTKSCVKVGRAHHKPGDMSFTVYASGTNNMAGLGNHQPAPSWAAHDDVFRVKWSISACDEAQVFAISQLPWQNGIGKAAKALLMNRQWAPAFVDTPLAKQLWFPSQPHGNSRFSVHGSSRHRRLENGTGIRS
jgi:hypothetical protein